MQFAHARRDYVVVELEHRADVKKQHEAIVERRHAAHVVAVHARERLLDRPDRIGGDGSKLAGRIDDQRDGALFALEKYQPDKILKT